MNQSGQAQGGTQASAKPGAKGNAEPKRRARVHTRAALIDAAEAIFAERGAPTASIDEICTRAGFTRGAFYSNFRTVTDVFFALYERKTEELLSGTSGLADRLELRGDRDVLLEGFVEELLGIIPADTQWYALRALFGMRAATDPEIATVLRAHGEDFQRGITPLLEHVASTLGMTLAPDADEAARVVIAAHVGSVLQGPFVDEAQRLRRDAVLAALRGVLRPE
ncbi:TetR family transcriptional regulator [Leucobacter komagatae]|uniref:TetR family transcriptional regulator n=1 Tax=Leucobacter komagatae TaxID=55969 RepID=A0A542Y236_9MICO|nr:TetR/AcrR family transcriptional regulator [Leucobacter komagatae]TQL42135.1 TetR family transcriptional regulator [Leucobacter komagatae]